ncbi:MAG: glycosyltransferase, partial [Burkholderiales bacterium]
EWWGWRNDMAAVYASAHIVCLPSYREGLPKSLIEAAACGRPIVTTDVPGCRDTILPGETGLLVPPRNAPFLADALRLLLGDPNRRKAMGARARKLAEERFSIESIAAQTLAVYERALRNR